ncbi:DNA translocase FtsK [Fructilactobacillus vespulae]|uniref:DNA translocase FtsK n=1 Tax=Fructilactobacillus vespulae TaxID=1249630 RepID=UPI0039B42D50
MDRYDGPAFFRKYAKEKMLFNEQKHNYFSTKRNESTKKETKNKKTHTETNGFKEEIAKKSSLNLVQKTQSFTPRSSYKGNDYYNPINSNQISGVYRRAINVLEKKDDDLILFDFDNHEIHTDSTNVVNESASDDATVDSVANSEVTTNPDVNDVTTGTNFANVSEFDGPTEDSLPASAENVPNSDEANDNSDSISADNSVEAGQVDSSNLDSSEIYENENENGVDNSESSEKKTVKTGTLGQSLSDIFNDENGLADHLSLFSDSGNQVVEKGTTGKELSEKSADEVDQVEDENDEESFDSNNQEIGDQPEKVEKQQPTYEIANNDRGYHFPDASLLTSPVSEVDENMDNWIMHQAETLDKTLSAFGVNGNVVDWTNGPTVTQFQIKLDLGVKVNKITNLTDDLKMALAAKDIRIEAPIPGKSTVGIEIPNQKPRPVMLSEILESKAFNDDNSVTGIAMGVDIEGSPVTANLGKMPHALIAGATGSGKSVFINSLLLSLLYRATPKDLRMILIDPKAVELAPYNEIPHLLAPVISDPKEASAALKWVTAEMDNRYERLAAAGVRNVEQYNQKAVQAGRDADKLPYILVVIDELADLMMVASSEVQDYIVRITQKARAAGIHLIVATQRPSVDIVTGVIKNNIPTRIAFMVSSQVDSRTIIDQAGAERLIGKGDMLYLGNGANKPERLQGAFVTNQEVEKITDYVRSQGEVRYEFDPKSLLHRIDQASKHDDLWKKVLEYISTEDNVSTSKLQRVFSIGYNRSATIIDDLERNNLISGQHGSKPRDVYINSDDFDKLNI